MKKINVLVIDPTLKTINLVEVTEDYKDLQKLVGGRIAGVGYIRPDGIVGDYEDDFIYVNDDGLSDSTTDFVRIPQYAQEFYRGTMVIVGSDGEGDSTSCKMTVNDAKKFISFIPKEQIRQYI